MASLINSAVKKLYAKELGILSLPKRKWFGFKARLSRIKKYLATHKTQCWAMLILCLIVVAAVLYYLIRTYNQYARVQTRAEAFYSDLGNEYRRREVLIPKIVSVVNEYKVHEKETFKYVSDAREKLISSQSFPEEPGAPKELGNTLSKLFALFEQYPDLKATQTSQDLIQGIIITANRIIDAQAKYNIEARANNQLMTAFPTNILGRLYGYTFLPYHEGSVNLSDIKPFSQVIEEERRR